MRNSRAFTLLEMLAVLAILAILMVAIAPAVHSISKSYGLGIASQMLADEIHLCRSLAAGLNKPIDLCFFRRQDEGDGWFTQFNSRSLEQDGTLRWLSQPKKMPEGIVISADKELSNILGYQTVIINTEGRKEICLRFAPSGEMDLVSPDGNFTDTTRFITLGYETDFARNPETLPSNFATIQIDRKNSQAIIYRP